MNPVAPAVMVRLSGGLSGWSTAAPPPLEIVGEETFTLAKVTL